MILALVRVVRLWPALILALAALSLAPAVKAQSQSPASPAAPTAAENVPPLPDVEGLDVAWPTLSAEEAEAPVAPAPASAPQKRQQQKEALKAAEKNTEVDETGLRYQFHVEGIDSLDIADSFNALSALYAGRTSAVSNIAQLRRRVREDIRLMERLLRSKGYYAAIVDSDIIPPNAEQSASDVRLIVQPGPRYVFSDVILNTGPQEPQAVVQSLFKLKSGMAVDAADVLAAETHILTTLPEQGYPFVHLGTRNVVIDHEDSSATYKNTLITGPRAIIGKIRNEGDKLVSERHIAMLAKFHPDEVYDARKIEDLRRALVATGLYGGVSMRAVPTNPTAEGAIPAAEEVVDIIVRTEKAPLRTIAGQVGYATDEGARVEASWQHRNLLPPEGAVTLRGILGEQVQLASASLRRSNWRARDRVLAGLIQASHENRTAYEAYALSLSGRIERETNLIWQKKWVWSFGGEFSASQERDLSKPAAPRSTFLIGALPVHLGYDGTDDLLDPHRGIRLMARLSPEATFQNGFFGYTKTQIDGSAYLPLGGDNFVLAGRARFGTIFGASRGRLAPSRRFYAGGGGSVRGYDYQKVGPRDGDGNPLGGRSLLEFSAEARVRFGNFGVAPFVDAGTVDTRSYPRFRDLSVGAGVGLRYYTNFGPIRIDVATPLNRRPGDSRIGVYVSIGQAF